LRSDFSSAFLIFLLQADYCGCGVEALGDGDGDSSVVFFFAVFLGEADGDASVEADVEVFFVVEVFLAEVDAAWVVVPEVVAAVSSFFCD
jgi:hypothetical protein